MNTYSHHLGDYAKDTKDLSPIEHGVYRLLLDFNYATEQPIPTEFEKLYRIVGARTHMECQAVRLVAERFFPVNGDGRRHNKRAEEEIEKYLERVEHNREVGRRGGRPKTKPENNPDGFPPGSIRVPLEKPGNNPSHKPEPEETKASTANAVEVRDAVANVPDCPHEKLVEAYHELLPTCTRIVEWHEARRALMRARWREKAQPNGKHQGYTTVDAGLAYWRRFFTWCAESEFLTGRSEPTPGRKPFVATLEWLIRPKNFAKVVEGTYHT